MGKFLNDTFSDKSISGLESLKKFYAIIIEKISSEDFHFGCLYADLAAELGGVNNTCSQALADAMGKTGLIFKQVIERGQEDKSIRSDIDSQTLMSIMTNAFSGIILKMKVDRNSAVGHDFIDSFLDKMMTS
jgi:TetR/AcrR family transcriptional repressor of nem operon